MKSNWDNLALAARFGIGAYAAYQGYKRQGDISDYFSATKKRPRLPTYTTTVRKRKKQQGSMNGPHFQKTRGRYGRRRRVSVNSRLKVNEEKSIDRFQGVSRFGIGGGFYKILKYSPENGEMVLPFHVMDLSYQKHNNIGVTNFYGHQVLYYNGPGTEILYNYLPSMNDAGTVTPGGGVWQNERGNADFTCESAVHNWTEVKFNLYGAIYRPMRYRIILFKMSEDSALGHSAGGDVDMRTAVETLIRPYLYSNLLQNTGELGKHVKVLKSWYCDLDPLSKEDQAAVQTTENTVGYNPHFRQVKLFIRHNMRYRYDWYNQPPVNGLRPDLPGWDPHVVNNVQVAAHAYPSARLYLGIMASCADIADDTSSPGGWNARPDKTHCLNYGSYDMVVRRCFTYPKN